MRQMLPQETQLKALSSWLLHRLLDTNSTNTSFSEPFIKTDRSEVQAWWLFAGRIGFGQDPKQPVRQAAFSLFAAQKGLVAIKITTDGITLMAKIDSDAWRTNKG